MKNNKGQLGALLLIIFILVMVIGFIMLVNIRVESQNHPEITNLSHGYSCFYNEKKVDCEWFKSEIKSYPDFWNGSGYTINGVMNPEEYFNIKKEAGK